MIKRLNRLPTTDHRLPTTDHLLYTERQSNDEARKTKATFSPSRRVAYGDREVRADPGWAHRDIDRRFAMDQQPRVAAARASVARRARRDFGRHRHRPDR